MELLVLRAGDARYNDVVGALTRDDRLRAEVWAAAESELQERPDKTWVVAVDAGRALAWCAFQPSDEPGYVVKAVDSYVRPEAWHRRLYPLVFFRRHQLIRAVPAVTYVFDQPLALHFGCGWVPTGDGWSSEPGIPPHHWTRLVRDGDAAG